MARWAMEFEVDDAGAEERIRTLAAMASSAFRMKVISAGEVGKTPIIPVPATPTVTIAPPPPAPSPTLESIEEAVEALDDVEQASR